MKYRAAIAAALACLLGSCRMEPPLHLAEKKNVEVRYGEIMIDLAVVWGTEPGDLPSWWYGWDADDERLWGPVEYPVPESYELRFYYLGTDSPEADYLTLSAHHYVTETRVRKQLDYGYHNVLAWSNVVSSDGTQALVVDESDPANIIATTSRTRAVAPSSRTVLNNPEVFYGGYEAGFEISDDPADYTYYLEDEGIWVKQLRTELAPRVYIYLVQVAIYNNAGRVEGVTDLCSASGLAAAVQMHTGRTSYNDVCVAYEMRMKHDVAARDGRHADILGGKLTTFGLCSMEGWSSGRGPQYNGARPELPNVLTLGLRFATGTDSTYTFNVTPQFHEQTHGGVITVEIDADTLPVPSRPGGGTPTGGFDPVITPADSVEHIFPM